MEKKKIKISDLLSIGIMFLIGAAVIIFGVIFCFQRAEDNRTFRQTEATTIRVETYKDSDGDTHKRAYFLYYVDGEEYVGKLRHLPVSLKEGDRYMIQYDPNNPQRIENAGETGIVAITMIFIIGLVCFAPGVLRLIKIKKKE